jgi:EGF-like domain
MKRFHSVVTAIFLLITIVQFSSCERDKCKTRDVVCKNNGTCNEGNCICPAGFVGTNCDTAANQKFVDVFGGRIVFPSGSLYPNGYFINDTIRVAAIVGDNLGITWMHRHPAIAGIVFNGKISNNEIVVESFKASNGYTYKGSGSLNSNYYTITMQADSMLGGLALKTYNYTFIGARTQ